MNMAPAWSFAGALLLFLLFLHGANARTETVLYSFCSQSGCADGQYPNGLIAVKGILYGTTEFGGARNKGTVFSLDPATGTETVLHSFCDRKKTCADGAWPYAGLIDVNGTLYGTTRYGGDGPSSCFYYKKGSYPCGTVFSINPKTGAETVVYSFCSQSGCTDGEYPQSSLITVNGSLYGTTLLGGTGCYNGDQCGQGTVFSINLATGLEVVVYSFCSQANCMDGLQPQFGVAEVNGALYGTTSRGGSATCDFGCGTAFSLDPATGAEAVLHDFCSQENCADGDGPTSGLIAVNGTLYGSTASGGSGRDSRWCTYGCGTVFSLDPESGAETVIYSFCSQHHCRDGMDPRGGLIDVKGTLYGATGYGGTGSCYRRCGTVVALDPNSGAEKALYAFPGSGADGAYPLSGVIDVGGVLYGTTYDGGAHNGGTVFVLSR